MKYSYRVVSCLGLLFVPALFAQPAPARFPTDKLLPTVSAPDPIRAELQAVLSSPETDELTPAQDQLTEGRVRRKQADRFLRAADKAKAFRAKYPDRPEAAEAKSIEAKSLLSAAMAADDSQEARASALVAELRADVRLPAKTRLEVVALAEVVRLQPLMENRGKFLAATEASARNLITEFPGEAGGYEALFRLAENLPNEVKGVALAQEIMATSAPSSVKELVQVFLDRQALVGQSLPKIADEVLGSGNPISAAKGKRIILYSWASWNPGSVAFAKSLNDVTLAETILVGVNLDKETSAAKALAQAESLPGRQVYDERGLRTVPLVVLFSRCLMTMHTQVS